MSDSLSPKDRKELIRAYKETPRTMGVYWIRHTESGRCLVGTSVDVPSILNRHRAQLRMDGHPSRDLQRDWNVLGQDAFAFEILDTLEPQDEPQDEPGYDPADDLKELEAMWVEKLEAEGAEFYGGSRRGLR